MSTATPFPQLTPEMLRHAHSVLTGPMAALKIGFDGEALGVTTPDGTPVETIWVTLRDLEFIHSLDSSRFGRAHECPFCLADTAEAFADVADRPRDKRYS